MPETLISIMRDGIITTPFQVITTYNTVESTYIKWGSSRFRLWHLHYFTIYYIERLGFRGRRLDFNYRQ